MPDRPFHGNQREQIEIGAFVATLRRVEEPTLRKMSDATSTRLDKWLWAARFFKTRTLASDAVGGGLVHLNGARTKASRAVKTGDELTITKRSTTWTVIVRAIDDRRRSAPEAQALYEETAASISAREAAAAAKREDPWARVMAGGERPSKRNRREIDRLRRRR